MKADELCLSEEELSLITKIKEERKNELKSISVCRYSKVYLRPYPFKSKELG